MTPQKRRAIMMGVMVVMLIIAAAWNINWLVQRRSAAHAAAADLAQCRRIVQDIAALRTQPAVASTDDTVVQEQALAQRIRDASVQAQLSGPWLQGVDHRPARRVGDTPYLRKPAVIVMRGVSLRQLATLLYHLTDGSELNVSDLRLRTPPGDLVGGTWNAEATLTYLIYSPTASARRDN